MKIVRMKTEYQTNPIGIGEKAPVFGWNVETDKNNWYQDSYRILVSDNMEELQKNTEPEDSKEELNTSEGIAQELLKTAKKQLFYTRLSTSFVGVMAAAIVISLFSVVPRANHLLGNANALLGEVNDRLEVLDETIASVKTMSDSITSVGDQLDTFIEDNSTALQGVVKKMDSIDFEGLNKSIKNLGDVVEPLAKFFKVF